jgi:RNA polymerase sigma factor (sigma-70 family)
MGKRSSDILGKHRPVGCKFLTPKRMQTMVWYFNGLDGSTLCRRYGRVPTLGGTGCSERNSGNPHPRLGLQRVGMCWPVASYGLEFMREQSENTAGTQATAAGLSILYSAARRALDIGDVVEARCLIDEAFEAEPSLALVDDWQQLRDTDRWPDAWLVAAVRRDPPDTKALDVLAERHWKPLFARCQLLTLNHQKADDLAQEAWCRVLRARHGLKPDGNFPAYLTTIATNLWRDRYRANRRAGDLAEDRMLALDAPLVDGAETVLLRDALPDRNALDLQDQALLALDIDKALERLTPQLRDVLVSRFIVGESCAEIGQRYRRTEQTISGWVRAAVREMRLYFEEAGSNPASKDKPI